MAEKGLIFVHGVMSSGKTTALLHERYSYISHGFNPLLLKPRKDDRHEQCVIRSRAGLETEALEFGDTDDILVTFQEKIEKSDIILVDEAQFLTKMQVEQLLKIYQRYDKLVKAYGLRTDYRQQLFEGSLELLRCCTGSIQLPGLCYCGEEATVNTRINMNTRKIITTGEQVLIDKELKDIQYVAMCQHCLEKGEISEKIRELVLKYKK